MRLDGDSCARTAQLALSIGLVMVLCGPAAADQPKAEEVEMPPAAPRAQAQPPPPAPEPEHRPAIRGYVAGFAGGGSTELDAAGFNTAGPFSNYQGFSEGQGFGGGAVGVAVPVGLVVLRADASGESGRGTTDFVTGSFPGPPGPSAFFYAGELDIDWTVLGNVWVDLPLRGIFPDTAFVNRLVPFIGGGAGASAIEISTNDTVVAGSRDRTSFTWQVGAGMAYEILDWLAVEARWRHIDFGEVDVPLLQAGGAPAGNYRVDTHANEGIFAVRFTFP